MKAKLGLTTFLVIFTAHLANGDLVLSNTGQAPDSKVSQIGVNSWYAIPFMTDGNRYELTSATARMTLFDNSSIRMEIWDSGNFLSPNSKIGTLGWQSGLSSTNNQGFSGSITLESDTSYFLVLMEPNGGVTLAAWWQITTTGIDLGVPWRFGTDLTSSGDPAPDTNRDLQSSTQGASWIQGSHDNRGYFTLDATVIPEPMSLTLIAMAGGGILCVHRWRKRPSS